MARIGQSRPDHGLGFQVRVLKTFQVDHLPQKRLASTARPGSDPKEVEP